MHRRDTLLALIALGAAPLTGSSVSAADASVPTSKVRPVPGAANVDWSSAQIVTVQLVDDRFVPDKLVFQRGVPYRLHMENSGADMHEFTAPEFLKAIAIRNPDVLEPTQQNEVLLQPKEQKDLYFVAQKPGSYKLTCANHDWDGMIGSIIIE